MVLDGLGKPHSDNWIIIHGYQQFEEGTKRFYGVVMDTVDGQGFRHNVAIWMALLLNIQAVLLNVILWKECKATTYAICMSWNQQNITNTKKSSSHVCVLHEIIAWLELWLFASDVALKDALGHMCLFLSILSPQVLPLIHLLLLMLGLLSVVA